MKPYLGKWVRYAGHVSNVYTFGEKVEIRFKTPNFTSIKASVPNDPDLADVLHVGDAIEVVGKIVALDSVTLALADAEVVAR